MTTPICFPSARAGPQLQGVAMNSPQGESEEAESALLHLPGYSNPQDCRDSVPSLMRLVQGTDLGRPGRPRPELGLRLGAPAN